MLDPLDVHPGLIPLRFSRAFTQRIAPQSVNVNSPTPLSHGPGQVGGGRQQIGGARGSTQDRAGIGGQVTTDGNNLPWGNARSIRQMLTQQDIEDFLNQPELFRELLEPIIELEGALRAQAELDAINNKLYATVEEDIPDQYRDLVQEYYRVLSENQGSESPQ